MPKGIYVRRLPITKAQLEGLKKGHSPEIRAKAREALKRNATLAWREKVSEVTKIAMHRPEVRRKHLAGLKRAGFHLKGGNGQPPVPKVLELSKRLCPLGFRLEYPIRTRGHGTEETPPTSYKVDFGHPIRKIAVEVDGPSHRAMKAQRLDRKKTTVLNALGWIVARVRH